MNGDKWFGYDDEFSIRRKAEYIQSMGLAGGMLWSIDTDDFRGLCGRRFGLLETLNEVSSVGKRIILIPKEADVCMIHCRF